MYSVIIDNKIENSSKKQDINVNFGNIYLFLTILGIGLIYYYSYYQNNDFVILIPYRVLWSIFMIFIGISILKVKNIYFLILFILITLLSVAITITSVFVYSSNIESNVYNSNIPILDSNKISSNIDLIATKTKIKVENNNNNNNNNNNILKINSSSNYDNLAVNNYIDENRVENIKLDQKLFPPGIGLYNKNLDIVFPNKIPIDFKIKSNLSYIEADLSGLELKSGNMKIDNSIVDMVIKDIKLEDDIVLDISSNLSMLNISISEDISVILSNASSLSQIEFTGMSKDSQNSDLYQTTNQKNISDETLESEQSKKDIKKLIINLKSTLSQVKISQK